MRSTLKKILLGCLRQASEGKGKDGCFSDYEKFSIRYVNFDSEKELIF